MVCIPAVMQNISNPIPEIELPDWFQKKTFDMRFHKQEKILSYGFGIGKISNQTPKKNINNENKAIESEKINKHKDLFEGKKNQTLRNRTKNPFSMKKNFTGWLQEQKKIWRNYKRETA